NGTPAAHTFASVSTVKCSGCDYSRTKLTLETLDIVNGELTYTFAESSGSIEITATLTAAADLTSVTVSSINLAGDNDKTFVLDTSGVSMTIPLTADDLAKATVVAYGKTVETVPFIKGWLVTLTAPAAKEGYEFDGWELDGTTVSTNSVYTVTGKTADFTITAVFGKVATGDNTPTVNNKLLAIAVALNSHRKYTVSFKSVGSRLYDVQTLKRGETVILPEAPAKEGYTFAGWYRDINGIKPFDTDSKITKSITLYAKWVKN
ncbi:MAG: InlB B-repeat-containing protein, partial [Clostridia bacterium]|nr:InlB B-repeat-containing protein [Clostridia bacterium]